MRTAVVGVCPNVAYGMMANGMMGMVAGVSQPALTEPGGLRAAARYVGRSYPTNEDFGLVAAMAAPSGLSVRGSSSTAVAEGTARRWRSLHNG